LRELLDKGMQGVVFHGRYCLEMPYLGRRYLERVRFGVEEANRLGLDAWIYDEMNWLSGTADSRGLKARPDLAQRYLECVSFEVRGPWLMCLTTAFDLAQDAAGGCLLFEVPMRDDVLEVEVSGRGASVRLWDPYVVDITSLVRRGRNEVALRVANTPTNLLNGVARPSGTPRLRWEESDTATSASTAVVARAEE
jgi:hypothetical protein